MTGIVDAEGFLFAGDLHLSSRPPSRRREDYMEAGLAKVRRLVEIANARRLVLVFTGDVFHHSLERNEALKTRLKRALNDCWTTVLTNVGNHDMKGLRLSDADTLAVIGETGRPLRVIGTSGDGVEVRMGGRRVGLGFTPYGQVIPADARAHFPDADAIAWVTHHDVAFEGAYPGAVEPFEIAGCAMVINGHMHLEKAPVMAGGTLWCNFGSIMRTAIDAVNHDPCAWAFSPATGLERVPLEFERDAFDLTGSLIEAASPGELVSAAGSSVFVDLLEATRGDAAPVTADGVLLLDALNARLAADGVRPEVRVMALDLHRRSVERRKESQAA